MAKSLDVLVVGAGAAGISTAATLLTAGKEVLVLEARERVGGRIFSEATAGGTFVELGAQWQAEKGHDRLGQLIQRYGYKRLTHDWSGKTVVLQDNGTRKLVRHGEYGTSYLSGMDFMLGYRGIDGISSKIAFDSFDDRLAKYDDMLYMDYCRQHSFGKCEAMRMHEWLLKVSFCRDPGDISVFTYCHASKSVDDDIEAEYYYTDEGLSNLMQRYADDFPGKFVLNATVTDVDVSNTASGAEVLVRTREGQAYTAKHVVLAFPPQLLQRIQFSPPLPPEIIETSASMLTGQVVKLVAVFASPWWRKHGYSGEVLAYTGPFGEAYDLSHSNGNGVIVAFSHGSQAEEMCEWPRERLQSTLQEFLRTSFGCFDEDIQELHYHNWIRDPDAMGGFGSFVAKGEFKKLKQGVYPSVGSIHFAGTEYGRDWRGYIEGALESGERAANNILSLLA